MKNEDPFSIFSSIGVTGDLSGKFKTAWTEGALDIDGATDKRWGVHHTKNYLGTSISRFRIFWFGGVIVVGFLIIFLRVFYLQGIKGNVYRGQAEGNRLRLASIPSERGIIYDRYNKELVRNIPSFTLALIPQDLPQAPVEREAVLTKVAGISGLKKDDLVALLNKYGSYGLESLVVKENLDYETALTLYIQNADLPGVAVESGTKRQYLYTVPGSSSSTPSLSHVLGYVGKLTDDELTALHPQGYLLSDQIGRTALEKQYETELRGIYGQKKIEVNAMGKEQTVLAVNPPVPGNNLILSIDLEAQQVLEKLMKASSEKSGKKRMAAVAMNPNTGEILAMVSYPSFNNNDFSGGISADKYKAYLADSDRPLFNRVISGTYPPGSTVKLTVSAGALQENIVTRATSFLSNGGLHVAQWFFKDWKAGGHGITNVTKALAWSVNTFFYYVGGGYDKFVGLGLDRLLFYFRAFNISQKTGIDLPGEASGFLPSRTWKQQHKGESWFIGDTYNLSIGQGDMLVTPLQVAVWTAAIANGGTIVTPHLATKLVDPADKKTAVLTYPSHTTGISPANIAIVQDGVRECVMSGTCQLLKTLPFTSAAKTGTAQWSSTSPTHAWFTSFAPFEKPQIVVTVLVESGGEGSFASMPIARDFLAWWGKKYLAPHG